MTGATLTTPARARFGIRRGWRAALFAFGATLVLGIELLAGASLFVGLSNDRAVMPGVQLAGVDIAGLDRAAATARLNEALPSLSAGSATLVVHGEEHVVTFAELGRGYELEAMLDAAFGVARSGNPMADGVNRLRALIHPTSLPAIVRPFEPPALDAATSRLLTAVNRDPVDAVANVSASGEFAVTPAVDGVQLDASTLQATLSGVLGTADPASVTIPLSAELTPPAITTEQAEAAVAAAQAIAAEDLALTVGDDSHALTSEQLAGWISFGITASGEYGPIISRADLQTAVAALSDAVALEPRSATFSLGATGGPTGVVPGQEGRELNVDGSVSAIMAALDGRAAGESLATVPLAVTTTEPPLSTAAAQAALPLMELAGTHTTYYVTGPSNHYGANINIPARDIDGTVLAPGDWFSFWDAIGPVTVERGYGMGGAIINGRTVLDGALAGGICSTSTTIFNAALKAGLEIGDRKAHSYYISRYPVGLDATVWLSDSFTQDMTFRNDTDQPILIRGFGGDGWVRFDVWSPPTGRSVAFSEPVISNRRAAGEIRQVTSALPPGVTRRDQEPYNGFEAVVNRTVRDAGGTVIHSDRFHSDYKAVDSVILVGAATAAPPAPPPPPASDGVGDQPSEG